MTKTPLLSTPEVADLLGKSKRTVHRLVESGELVPVHQLPGVNGAFLFRAKDVERLLARTAA